MTRIRHASVHALSSRLRTAVASAAVLAAASAALAETTAAPAGGAQPKMVIGEVTYDAKDVHKGDVIERDFAVKNEGKADLNIVSVAPSCGCTAPDWTKIVPPGGSGKITLKIDTSKFKGPITKTAQVTTNDPTQPTFRLTVNANVRTFVDILPKESVSFRQLRGEDKFEAVTIHSNEPGEFKINDVQVTGTGIKHDLSKATDGSGDYRLRVSLDKTVPVGTVAGSIKLLTNSAKEPEVTVEVTGTVLSQINLVPSTLYFRIDQGAGGRWSPTTDNLNVRATGDPKGELVGKLPKTSVLTQLEAAGDWLKVRSDATPPVEGWVSKSLVAPARPDAAAVPENTKSVTVTHRDENATFKVVSTTVEGPKLDAKAIRIVTEPVKDGQSYRLTVTYLGGLPKGNYNGAIVVKTTDKDEAEVRLPVYVIVI